MVNPEDYFTRVFPATTVRAADGTYSKDVFPFPTTVVQSAAGQGCALQAGDVQQEERVLIHGPSVAVEEDCVDPLPLQGPWPPSPPSCR